MSADHLLLTPEEVYERYVQASRMGADLLIRHTSHRPTGTLVVNVRLQKAHARLGAATSRHRGRVGELDELDVSLAILDQLTLKQ